MKRQVKVFEITCDYCKKTVTVNYVGSGDPPLPKGWGVIKVHGCGMTDYTRYDDACPACLKKYSNK